jgi:putative heme-binding domain-containing protein
MFNNPQNKFTATLMACIAAIALVANVSSAADNPHVASTPHLSPADERQKLTLPEGFDIHLVAAEPDIAKPLNMAFDHRGRIWVTDTVDYPFPAEDGNGNDTVKILEDTDGDGRADKITTFAENLTVPIGILPLPDGAIVFSVPSLYRLYDDDGDDKADRKELLVGPFDQRDTHGMINSLTWGFDGWIYLTHGFANQSRVKGKDGHEIVMHSGHTWRMTPDADRIENWSFGQVNPFGMAFDPFGNMWTSDCHTKPVQQVLRGAYYQSFGKPHDGIGYGPEICAHSHGSTAIDGMVYYSDNHFPPAYRDNTFIGNVITCRVNRDTFDAKGATRNAVEQPDLIKSDDPWFRPVDMQLGPDGALYIADFYNRIIGHYEVPLEHPGRDRTSGRIWRVTYAGHDAGRPPRIPRADWSKSSVAELIEDLAHPSLWVRTQAANQLVFRIGKDAITPLRTAWISSSDPFVRSHGLWVLHRLSAADNALLRSASRDQNALLRVHLMRILADEKSLSALCRDLAINGLSDADARVRMAAAEALAQHPAAEHLPALLARRKGLDDDDRQLKHMVRMSIRDQLKNPAGWAWVNDPVNQATVGDFIADVAEGSRTSGAGAYLFTYLQQHNDLDSNRLKGYVHHATRYAPPEDLPKLFALIKDGYAEHPDRQVIAIQQYRNGLTNRGAQVAPEVTALADTLAGQLLEGEEGAKVGNGITLVRLFRLANHQGRLVELAVKGGTDSKHRKAACDALIDLDAKANIGPLGQVIANAAESMDYRIHAARTLGQVRHDEAVNVLATNLATAPERLSNVLAEGLAQGDAGGERLLEEIEAGKASPRLLTHRPVIDRMNRLEGVKDAKARIETLTEQVPTLDDRIAKMINDRRQGYGNATKDAALGAKVFEATCSACHRIGDVGGKIGPELHGIGIRGIDRILEDTLDPSRNVDQAFRTTVVELKDGVVQTGLLQSDEGQVLTFADPEGKSFTVPKDRVADRYTSKLSLMPSNIAEDLPEADFFNLIAYLLAQKQTDSPADSE